MPGAVARATSVPHTSEWNPERQFAGHVSGSANQQRRRPPSGNPSLSRWTLSSGAAEYPSRQSVSNSGLFVAVSAMPIVKRALNAVVDQEFILPCTFDR